MRPLLLLTSVCIFVAVGVDGSARPQARTVAPAAKVGNELVAPNGADTGANCRRFTKARAFPADRATVCGSLMKAYALARPGDVIIVGNGTYAATQRICRGGDYPSCSSTSADRPSPAITFRAETRHGPVIRGELLLGSFGLAPPPSNVTFDGIDVNGQIHVRGTDAAPAASNVTFENMHIWTIADAPELDWGLVSWDDGNITNLMFRHLDVGPFCCRGDGFYLPMSTPHLHVPVNVTIEDSSIHDLFDTCKAVPTAVTDKYGACVGTGFGDNGVGDHVDGIQVWGGVTGLHLLRDKWWGVGLPGNTSGQTIFLECGDAVGRGRPITCTNVDLVQNMVFAGSGTQNNTVSIQNHYPGTNGIAGDVRILYNTFWAACDRCNVLSVGSPSGNGLAPSATLEVIGNIAKNWSDQRGNDTCRAWRQDGSSFTPTFAHNVFGNIKCSATDRKGTPTFVSSDQFAPDEHLVRGSLGIGTGDPDTAPRNDVDGRFRPVHAAPDSGASQRESALLSPVGILGEARLGMREHDVERFYGTPSRTTKRKLPAAIPVVVTVARYRLHGSWLDVTYDGDTVVGVATASEYYSTTDGFGVSAAVPGTARSCGTSVVRVKGGVAEVLGVRAGRVTSVTLERPRYLTC